MKKSVLCGLLCLLLVVGMVLPAQAEPDGRFLRQRWQVREDELLLFGSGLPADGTAKATVGGRSAADVTVSTVEAEALPVTLFCLVDHAIGLADFQLHQEREILRGLNARMGEQDNMVFAYMNDNLKVGDILHDRVARDKAIRDLIQDGHYSRIHKAVSQSVNAIQIGQYYHENIALLIFSDGMDDFKTEFKEAGVSETIRKADIPVFGVGLIQTNANWEENDRAKLMERYAACSMGGKGFVPNRDGLETEAVADEIWKTMQNSPVFRIPLTWEDGSQESVTVKLEYKVNGVTYVQSMEVTTEDFPQKPEEPEEPETEPETEAVEEPQTEAPTETEAVTETDSGVNWVPIVAGACAAAVLVTVGIVLAVMAASKKKKQVQTVPAGVGATEAVPFLPQTTPVEAGGLAKTLPLEQNLGKGGCNIRLVPENGGTEVGFFLVVNEPKTVGRDQRADLLLHRSDEQLSGCHAELLWDSEMLLLRDRMSTNGTYLNGSRLLPGMWAKASEGDRIQMGSFVYRVFCQKVAGDPNLRF